MVHHDIDIHPPEHPQTKRPRKLWWRQGDDLGVGWRGSPGEHEIIEERERIDEAQDIAGWEHGECHAEGFEEWRESVKLHEGSVLSVDLMDMQA